MSDKTTQETDDPLKVRFLCEHHLIAHPECSNATEVDPRDCAYKSKSSCRPAADPPGAHVSDKKRDQWLDRHE